MESRLQNNKRTRNIVKNGANNQNNNINIINMVFLSKTRNFLVYIKQK